MKALVFNGPRDIRYETYDDPALTLPNGVIVKVEACSICGSDLHIYHGDMIGSASYGSDVAPFCVGHEFIGEIVETGTDVHTVSAGDRVFCAGGAPCGRCKACVSKVGRCRAWNAFGLSTALQGGQAEYVQVPCADTTVRRIPDGVTDEQALLLTDALATAQFGISRCDIESGDTVAVVGLGPIGLLGVELAFLHGASRVLAIDPVEARRDHAERLGATALTPGDDLVKVLVGETRGAMADRVFEASGATAAIESAVKIVRPGGTVSFVGLPQGAALEMRQVLYRNLTVRAGVAPVPELWASLLPLLEAGRLRADGLYSHRFALADGAAAYDLFDRRDDGVLKVFLDLHEAAV
jgi:2-desacetyl-2-hydroxyethyl bacteriochlorophyllide A dehydrogenase